MYNTHYAYNPARAKSLSKQMFKPELWNTPSIKNPIEYSTTYRVILLIQINNNK